MLELLPEPDWLARRKLSASRIAAVYTERMGLLTLWAILTGKETEEFPELLGDFGRATEPVSRKWFAKAQGVEILPGGPSFAGGGHWLISGSGELTASPDTLIGEGALWTAFAEHKTSDRVMAWKWSDGPDRYPWVQIQATFAAARAAGDVHFGGAYSTVLIGNGYDADQDFRVFPVEPDEDFIGEIREWAFRFWRDHVEADIPPPVDGLEATLKTIRLLFPPRLKTEPSRQGILPAEHWRNYLTWKALERQIDDLERQRDRAKQELEYAMGEAGLDEASLAATEDHPDAPRLVRRSYERKGYAVKPSIVKEFRSLK